MLIKCSVSKNWIVPPCLWNSIKLKLFFFFTKKNSLDWNIKYDFKFKTPLHTGFEPKICQVKILTQELKAKTIKNCQGGNCQSLCMGGVDSLSTVFTEFSEQ